MRVFHCNHCEKLVFFENTQCVNCNRLLAYIPDLKIVASLDPLGENLWQSPLPQAKGKTFRLCANYERERVCNWGLPSTDPNPFCRSCRLTRMIPDLSQEHHKTAWSLLEGAKRRLIYSLLNFALPLEDKNENPEAGLAYEFLADSENPHVPPILIGHANGVITIDVAEADDVEREKRRLQLHEPYRTLLGHFRHESGHYYWDRLIKNTPRITVFRQLFRDEREDYNSALQRHYVQGPLNDWQQFFISAYASTHAWEDWAETWAHYLHMTDALETAAACGLSLQPCRADEPSLGTDVQRRGSDPFERIMNDWFSLTYALNNLDRSLGLPDSYPFVLSSRVVEKLRFVHETIQSQKSRKNLENQTATG